MSETQSNPTPWLQKAKQWEIRFRQLMDMTENLRSRAELKEIYAQIKDELKSEIKELSRQHRSEQLNKVAYSYLSALSEASAFLTAPTTSEPLRWHSGLYRAAGDMTYFVHQFEHEQSEGIVSP